MTRVFIVDDHFMIIEGLKSLIGNQSDIELVGYATNGNNCLSFLQTDHQKVDVMLLDINLPDISGIDLCATIKSKYPKIKILGLSTFNQFSYINKMIDNGASGYVLKNADKEELLDAIHTINKGKTYLSFDAGFILKHKEGDTNSAIPVLTRREKEILTLIADGFTNAEIAEKLFIGQTTVDSHRKNLLAKLNVKNTATLIKFAVENKLI